MSLPLVVVEVPIDGRMVEVKDMYKVAGGGVCEVAEGPRGRSGG